MSAGVPAGVPSRAGNPGTAAGVPARRAAFRALRRVHDAGAWASPAVDAALRGARLDPRDRAFAANLAFETLRWQGTLDWALSRVVTRPLAEVEPGVLDVLRMGAWQLLYGRVPDRSAVDTSVDVARAEVSPRTSGFVNGVLRGLVRSLDTLPWPDETTDEGLGLALGYPVWVVGEARRRFGDRARTLLEGGNEPPGLTLRALGDPAQVVAELRDAGLDAEQGAFAPEAVRVPGGVAVDLPAVSQRRATPQDEASMLVSRALATGLDGWGRVLDACAGPGGKSAHLADLGLEVVASDLYEHRALLVEGLARRLDVADRVHTVVADATAPPLPSASCDGVLVDAPCTGLGVVRRRPELRWNRDAGDPSRLAQLQLRLLQAAARVVRPDGLVVYSACTWTHDETAAVVGAFLATHPVFRAEPPALAGAGVQLAHDPGFQLAPDTDGTDGMYVACLRRA